MTSANNLYQAEQRKRLRQEWFLANGPCVDCGSWADLEIDHVDRSLKRSHRVWRWPSARRDAELAKCKPRCRDCHKEKTRNERYETWVATQRERAPLTDDIIDELQPRADERVGMSDSGPDAVPGLRVRVNLGGSKSFSLMYRANGRQRRWTMPCRWSDTYGIARARADALRALQLMSVFDVEEIEPWITRTVAPVGRHLTVGHGDALRFRPESRISATQKRQEERQHAAATMADDGDPLATDGNREVNMKHTIRTTLTFTFDDARVSAQGIKDRLDDILCDEFGDGIDVHTRWVARLEDAPLFGAARQMANDLSTANERQSGS
jgi:hypothetical protein